MFDLQQAIKDGNERISISDAKLLLNACKHTNARTILEIGSYDGGSTIVLGDYAKNNEGMLHCIEPDPTETMAKNVVSYGLEEHVSIVKGFSPWIPTSLIPNPIDVLFIDGDHRTRWMLVDYHYFYPFVRSGGIICFHDWREDWQSKNPTNEQVRRGIEIILEDDNLQRFGNCTCEDLSTIVFVKP